ncbi:MAG: hypothetical protein HY918_02080 [Candidatus Doudnabacteria bacterium]|nr:hypothetical protein [Candidatus Doudnabacteria bacterium]
MNQNKFKISVFSLAATLVVAVSLFSPMPARAAAVGGRFMPGLFDIFTPNILLPSCGLTVGVIGTNGIPKLYSWIPTMIYDFFPYTISHIGNSMLGLATDFPVAGCPYPTLYLTGSSIAP